MINTQSELLAILHCKISSENGFSETSWQRKTNKQLLKLKLDFNPRWSIYIIGTTSTRNAAKWALIMVSETWCYKTVWKYWKCKNIIKHPFSLNHLHKYSAIELKRWYYEFASEAFYFDLQQAQNNTVLQNIMTD